MGKVRKDNVDNWLEKNASQRKALKSMLKSLQQNETPPETTELNNETRNTKTNKFMTKITQLFKKLGVLTLLLWLAGSLNIMAQEFVPGKIRVKVKPNSVELVANGLKKSKKGGQLKTSLTSLDLVNAKFSATEMHRVFPHAGRNEAKHMQYGLHLWYEIDVTSEADVQAVAREYHNNEYIDMSEPIRTKILDYDGVEEAKLPAASALPMTTNDPYLADQWHLKNDGTLPNSVAGSDINVFPAWDITAGTPNVVVAIVDGGIDTKHEDLIPSLWVNDAELNGEPGVDDDFNGYIDDIHGYNFAEQKGEITAHDHGTHVAGTVAAANNNGKGVAGVAGGTGNGDGARLLSAQVFSNNGSGNFAAAIVYGADNGAVISQNSWGYQSAGYYEQSVLDAIDYFIAEAGNYPGSPMKGGVVFFAAGNNGNDSMHYPGYYEAPITIASTGAAYKKAVYSNYGTWVDLSTTGGNAAEGSKNQVLSTMPGNRYGYMQGTSMATPHASGVAALIVSKYGSSTFTNEDLKRRILSGVRNIDIHNPTYEGKMGVGFMDAYLALKPNDNTAPNTINDLALLGASQDFATLSFSVPADSGDDTPYEYKLSWSVNADLSAPQSMSFKNGFMAAGEHEEITIEGLEFETTYFFTIIAVDRWGNESAVSNIVEATTNSGPDITADKNSISVSMDVATSTEAMESLKIINQDTGILNWKTETREVSASASATSIALPAAGTIKSVSQLKVEKQNIELAEKFATSGAAPNAWEASEKSHYYVGTTYVIGEVDTTMTNSSATKFVVDDPEGFNLTYVNAFMNLDQEDGPAVLEIYKGEKITKENLIYTDNRFNAYSENDTRNYSVNLLEHLFFKKGESFWVVFHTPAGNLYPLGMSYENSPEGSDYCMMSFDLGKTWVPLAGAVENENFAWNVKVASKVSPMHEYMTLSPSEGSIYGLGETDVDIAVDGSELINGTYKSNIVISSNDADTPLYRVPATVTVSGHKPEITTNSILDFGSVFNGLTSTKEMTIYNTGYGRFRTKTIVSSDPQFTVNTSVYSLNVAAKSESAISLTFTPDGTGNKNAVITMTSYNGDVHKFNVFGVGTEAAEIAVAPTVVNFENIMVGDNAEASVTITNNGQYPLQYGFPAYTNDVSHIENLPANVQRFPYTMESMPYDTYVFQDITADGTDITEFFKSSTLNEFYNVDLGFDFPFYGKSVNAINITKRGLLTLGEDGSFNSTSTYHGSHMPDGYIAAMIKEFAFSLGGSVHFKRELGKLIVQYTGVRHANDNQSVSMTFQIEIYSNGDIKFIYDKFDGMYAYQLNSIYSAIENEAKNDGVLVNSNYDKVYLPMAAKQIVHIHSPGLGLIKEVVDAKGMIQPGESKDIMISLDGEKLIEGTHKEYLSVLSNDPFNSSLPIEINIDVVGGGVSELVLSEKAVDLGEVFQMATVKGIVGLKNNGSKQIDLSDVSFTNGQLTHTAETSLTLEPNQTLFIPYTLNTENTGSISDILVITDGEGGTYEVNFTGTIIDAPAIEVVETSYSESMEPGQQIVKPFEVHNTGKATLEYAIAATEHVTIGEPATTASVEDFTYVYRSTYDDTMKPSHQWIKLTEEDKVEFHLADGINWEVIELPFEFEFYQEKYSKLWMGTQGVLSFDEIEDKSLSFFVPPMVPQEDTFNNFIAPYFAAGGPLTSNPEDTWGRYMKAFDDKVVFEWRGYINIFGIGGVYSAQAILYKNGKIKFQYKNDPSQPIRAFYGLVGIENKEGTEGLQIAHYQEYINNGVAIDIYPAKKETLEPGESRSYDLTFNTEGVNSGVYEESLKVFNNSPLTPEVIVPIDLEVTGEPALTFNPEVIELGEKIVEPGASYATEFSFINSGTKTMTVQNLRMEDGSTAVIEHLVYNFRWGWQWTTIRSTDSFIVEPGFESKSFRLTITPAEANEAYVNKVLADTDFGTTEELLINAVFKLPPSFTVNEEEIFHLAFNNDLYAHTLNLGNLEGESPLQYAISMNYLREDVVPAAVPNSAKGASVLLKQQLNVAPNLGVAPFNTDFANVLSHDNAVTPYTSVGYNGQDELITATEFIAPESGFNLSHVQTWYVSGSWLNSDINIEIRVGDNVENADVLYSETLNYTIQSEIQGGELITLELSETVELQPYERFYVVITHPLGATFPQGVAKVDEHILNRFKFLSGGLWFDIKDAGMSEYGWMVRAAEVTAAEKNWISIDGGYEGEIAVAGTLDLDVILNPARASMPTNKGNIIISTNDPYNALVSIPVTLEINQAPVLEKEHLYTVNEAETLNISIMTSDHEADMVTGATLISEDEKASLSFDNGVVNFIYTPDYEDSGIHSFDISLEDEYGIEGVSTITVEVIDVNRAPEVMEIETQYLNLYTGSYNLIWEDVFSDPDGDQVKYAASVSENGVTSLFFNENSMLVKPMSLGESTVTITGTDARGGSITTSFNVVVIGIVSSDDELDSSWQVHPNPVEDIMYLKMYNPVLEKINIKIYNSLGVLVKVAQSEGSDNMIEVPVSEVNPGVYYVELTTANAKSVKKIIKK
ncbi:S8 family serine peptidase [Robertkochia solimangrovi]|uniref:S8 family serine peptidase n=1 Tax=Robertkochia solimangrovi TaxID=2213046 RepID=UPI00117DC531|nr:S8 family serine peptidase [Robertkochia solimangrovi]TRZ46234.1 hypothetical protein DMZ48_02970 [Robertkochia solimangrovi]